MLARRFLLAFLAVTVPGTLLLGLVTLRSLDSLAALHRESVQIGRTLETTRDVTVPLAQAGAPLREYLAAGGAGHQQEFDRALRRAGEELTSCATASCHGASRTPQEMAAILAGTIARLDAAGRAVFATAGGSTGPREPGAVEAAIAGLVADIDERLGRMTGVLSLRQEVLRRQSRAVIERAWILAASLTVAVVLAASAAALVLARRISHPVHALLLGTRRVMAGAWDVRVGVADRGELGELAASFEAMVDELKRQRDGLDEAARTLEARVEERTAELGRKEAALRQAERLAALGLLAAGVAHELNNPLTSIVMNANLLIEEAGEGSALARELGKIDQDAARCRRIVDDLRTFARGQSLRTSLCAVEPVVEDALAQVAHELRRRGIAVERDLDPALPKVVLDPERMTQVLVNVLVNAAHAMADGGTLTVRARHDGARLALMVRDRGVGIPPAHRARIFDPFFTTKRDGTGLGLSISHGIVHEHGGRIEVRSVTRDEAGPGAEPGTTVTIVLPAARAAA